MKWAYLKYLDLCLPESPARRRMAEVVWTYSIMRKAYYCDSFNGNFQKPMTTWLFCLG